MLEEERDSLVALLLLSYEYGDLEEDDLLLLVLALEEDVELTNYKFNQVIGQRLRLEELDDEKCLPRFRFTKAELKDLHRRFRLPEKMTAPCRTTWTGMEGLLVVLRRLCYPNRLGDLCEEFGRSKPVLSMIFNITLIWIHNVWGDLLTNPFDKAFFTQARLESYAAAIARRTRVDLKVISFIDGTVRPICRPSQHQRLCYNGHKRVHALKYQCVTVADGLIFHMYGPIEGRRHDSGVLAESGLLQQLQQHMEVPGGGRVYAIYGDAAYPLSTYIQKAFQGAALTPEQLLFNTLMNSARQTVEWEFGQILSLWAYVDFKKQQKIFLQPVSIHYKVAALMTNLRTIVRKGNNISKFFGLKPPTLDQYLQ